MPATDANALHPVGFQRLRGLDGLRAISICAVLLGHSWDTVPLPARLKDAIAPFIANASLGVTVFFVLSGYLITHLLMRERTRYGRIGLRPFYARRVLRIFPALYTYLLVIAVLSLAGVLHTTGGDLFRAGTFLTNYGYLMHPNTNADYWFVGHFWTLSLEEQFYLFWPLTLAAAGVWRGRWVAAAIVLVTPFVRTASYFALPGTREHLRMMLHVGADPIMAGCLAALVSDEAVVRRAVSHRLAGPAAAVAALFLVLPSAWLAARFRGAYTITVGTTLEAGMIAYVVIYLVANPRLRAVRLLETPVLRTIGVLSYSLYLWQQLFLGAAHWSWAPFPVNLLAAFVAATLSSVLIERPFLKLRGRFAARPPTTVSTPVAATRIP